MNKALEIHDSTLNEIKKESSAIVLCLIKAIMHHSIGEPGVDKGTCWVQPIEIRLENPLIINEPEDIPNELDYGYFIINNTKYTNVIKTPFKESGEIELLFETFHGNKLNIKANVIEIAEAGKAQYLQDFEL